MILSVYVQYFSLLLTAQNISVVNSSLGGVVFLRLKLNPPHNFAYRSGYPFSFELLEVIRVGAHCV